MEMKRKTSYDRDYHYGYEEAEEDDGWYDGSGGPCDE